VVGVRRIGFGVRERRALRDLRELHHLRKRCPNFLSYWKIVFT